MTQICQGMMSMSQTKILLQNNYDCMLYWNIYLQISRFLLKGLQNYYTPVVLDNPVNIFR